PGTTNFGAWIGKASSDGNGKVTKIQFAGLAIYGTGFTKNVGNDANLGNASFVFAAYDEDMLQQGSAGTLPDVSGLNRGTTVVMPRYPFVNVNPQSSMGGDEIITGDGAVLRSTASQTSAYAGGTAPKTMALKIYEDIVAGSDSRRYTTFEAFNNTNDAKIYGDNKIDAYLRRTINDDGDRISTYKTERGAMPGGMSEEDDFAVIVIANQTKEETTNLINRYVQLVTNTATDYTASSSYYSIEVKTCKYENGSFVIDMSATPGLTVTTENGYRKFALNGAHADSNNASTFTLVDVQFKDPLTAGTNSEKIAYHLYVPVYTVKQIEVDFYSAVKTGTSSVSYENGVASTDYSSLMASNETYVDSLETWITQYIRYSYHAEDLNMLLDSNNVNWNNNKKVIFRTNEMSSTFKRLPVNTYMVLVDPNGNADRVYYAENLSSFDTYYDEAHVADQEYPGWVISLNRFRDESNQADFAPRTLNDLMARDIVVKTDGDLLYVPATEADYDVYRINGNGVTEYYKYAASGNGSVGLEVPDNYVLNEDYYISMYVPLSTELYFYEIKAPTELAGRKAAVVNERNRYSVIAADLYTQNTTNRLIVAPEDQQINASNHVITVKASTEIRLNNPDAKAYLGNLKLYHSFHFALDRYAENEVGNEIYGLDDSRILATYSIGSEASAGSASVRKKELSLQYNYIDIETKEIMSDLLSAADTGNSLTVYAYVKMTFDENQLDKEFPEKTSENNIGVNVRAATNLAYDEERLAYTSMSAAFAQDSHYYHRESVNVAKLYYAAVNDLDEYDPYGKMSENYSRLGINGRYSDLTGFMPVNTEAKYNVSAISPNDLRNAKTVRLTVTLSKKTDMTENGVVSKAEYVAVDSLSDYLGATVLVTSGTAYGAGGRGDEWTITSDSAALTIDLPVESCAVEADVYDFGLRFLVKTGDQFTEYSNYRITLRAVLLKEDGEGIQNSGVSDFVIYTNAKVHAMDW
ncbi:MAG: hypothetical protein K6F51_04655, partial [Acetatifactor sp.]|nr:hypothetical protein [Acetatifactor sp.]